MRTDLFDFDLPPGLIAQEPARPRDAARLLYVPADDGPFAERAVGDLPDLLRPGDLLVLNDTRVLPTRLAGRRGDVPFEATLVERAGDAAWWALARPGKRLRPGDRVGFDGGLAATVEAKDEEGRVRFGFALSGENLLAAIRAHGAMPLPPYIRRPRGGTRGDRDDYQPVFARREGAVAAPTASLHFTPELLARLEERGVRRTFATLHVGAGTFAPVKVEDVRDHRMHAEWYEVSEDTAAQVAAARAAGGRIVAVGTTALRALESAAAEDGTVRPSTAETRLFITPGYRFRAVDLLLTNFHLPRSTLLMLVAAFSGLERARAAYAFAVERRYRFFSYGDACLLERAGEGGR